uniref:Drought induced 19 protein type zinc-binding domain-containing protein n=1 Tax=Picea sitchensis TaxID=3332 RepID=A9NZE0_PICSI|nr:unknown [Picea sitchensis]
MDAEFWTSRMTAAKRQAALNTDQYFCLDDLEGDDMRVDFHCPFCYVDFDIASLCCLEEEHSFETTVAACPVCAVNVGNDIVGHITSQHSHLFKGQRRRKYLRGRIQSNSVQGRERLHSSVGGGSSRLGGCSSNDAPDPLLSSFIYGLPIIESHEQEKTCSSMDDTSTKNSSDSQAVISANSSVTEEESKRMFEEGVQRAQYVQQLVLSTILPDEF